MRIARIKRSSPECNGQLCQTKINLLLLVLAGTCSCVGSIPATGQVTVSLPQRVLEAKHTDYVLTQNPGTPNIVNVKSSNPSVATADVYRVKSVQIIAVAPGKTTVEFFDTVEGKLYQVPVWVTAPNESGGGGQGYNPHLTQLPEIVMLVKRTENAHTPNGAAAQISDVKSSNPSVATARTDPPNGIQIYSFALGDTWIEFRDNTTGTTYQVHVWIRDKLPGSEGTGGGGKGGKGPHPKPNSNPMPRPGPNQLDKCLVGRWVSESADFDGHTSGGAGAVVVIQSKGNISADYSGMSRIVFSDGGSYLWTGSASGHISADKGLFVADRVNQSSLNFDILDAHSKSTSSGLWAGTLGFIFPPHMGMTYTCSDSKLTIIQTPNNTRTTYVLARK
jgi:hypothetical protein